MIKVVLGAFKFGCLITLVSIGFTLCYLTTRVFNFSHIHIAVVGTFISLTLIEVLKTSIYPYLYLYLLVGGTISLIFYFFVIRQLVRRKASDLSQMIATIAFSLAIIAILNIYADMLGKRYGVLTRWFYLPSAILMGGEKKLLFVISLLTAVICGGLHLLLTKTRFGVALRASIENPELAWVMGINVDLTYAFSWFLAGGLACLSGAFFPFMLMSSPDMGWILGVTVVAASIAGGLSTIYGAMLGGLLIGFAEVLGTYSLASLTGAWIIPLRPAISFITLIITLLLAPEGLAAIKLYKLTGFFKKR